MRIKDPERFIIQEKATVKKLIALYCRHHHHSKEGLCPQCEDLMQYVSSRVDHCVFGYDKVNCENCPVHCYKPSRREEIRQVMRYAGPRMMIYHPIEAVNHVIRKYRDKKKIPRLMQSIKIKSKTGR